MERVEDIEPGTGDAANGSGAGDDSGNAGNVDGGGVAPEAGLNIGGITVVGSGDAEPPKRKRGRPPGSGKSGTASSGATKSAGKAKAVPPDAVGIETVLFGIHGMLAAMTKTQELMLEKDEAKELAKAIADVNAFYGKAIDPKVFAWIGLATVAGKIYAPRFAAIKLRMAMEAKPQKQLMRPMPPAPQPQQQAQAPAPVIDPAMRPMI